MRFTFTAPELTYLNDKFALIGHMARRTDIDSGLARTMAKMKYKFTPNAQIVFLNGKERQLLGDLLTYRQTDLIKSSSISEEVDTVQKLIERLEVRK